MRRGLVPFYFLDFFFGWRDCAIAQLFHCEMENGSHSAVVINTYNILLIREMSTLFHQLVYMIPDLSNQW